MRYANIDLARRDDVEHATGDLLAAKAIDLDDYFVFEVERTNDLDDALEGAAVRYRVTASLAGRRFEHVIVDVGFGDPLPDEPDLLAGPDLLAFAGVEPPRVPTIRLEQHVAEKVPVRLCIAWQAGVATPSTSPSWAASGCRRRSSRSLPNTSGSWRRRGHPLHSSCSEMTARSRFDGSNATVSWPPP